MYTKKLSIILAFFINNALNAQLFENFNSFDELGSYANGSFVGNSNIQWTYTYCKGGQTVFEGNKAICIGKADSAKLSSSVFTDTCLSFSLYYTQEYSSPVNALVCINEDTIAIINTSKEDSICYLKIDSVIVPPFIFSIKQSNNSGQLTVDDLFFELPGSNTGTAQKSALQFGDIIITEVMSDPDPVVQHELCEFIELYNRTDAAIYATDIEIWSNSNMVALDTLHIDAGQFIALGGTGCPQPIMEIEKFPSIANSGTTIKIVHCNKPIHEVYIAPHMHSSVIHEDGGWSLEMVSVDNFCAKKNNWASSTDKNGATPSLANSNFYELYDNLQLNEWYVQHDSLVILVFSHSFDIENLTLKINDELISHVNYSNSTQSCIAQLPRPLTPNAVSLINYNLCTCNNNQTSGSVAIAVPGNASPGDIEITEILFNELYDNTQFIEIRNNSSTIIDMHSLYLALFEGDQIKNYEKVSEIHRLLFPKQIIAIAKNKASLLEWYNCADSAVIENSKQQTFPNSENSVGIVTKQGDVICKIDYSNKMFSNMLNETKGVSLILNATGSYIPESANVHYASPGYIAYEPNAGDKISVSVSKQFYPDKEELAKIEIINKANEGTMSVYVFDLLGNRVKTIAEDFYFHTNAVLYWDGTDNTEQLVIGANYIIKICLLDNKGRRFVRKKMCAKM